MQASNKKIHIFTRIEMFAWSLMGFIGAQWICIPFQQEYFQGDYIKFDIGSVYISITFLVAPFWGVVTLALPIVLIFSFYKQISGVRVSLASRSLLLGLIAGLCSFWLIIGKTGDAYKKFGIPLVALLTMLCALILFRQREVNWIEDGSKKDL